MSNTCASCGLLLPVVDDITLMVRENKYLHEILEVIYEKYKGILLLCCRHTIIAEQSYSTNFEPWIVTSPESLETSLQEWCTIYSRERDSK